MFSLHVIQAEFGDCLLLEYGTTAERRFILIDGGPSSIFDDHLRPVLEQKVVPVGGLERVILSHVDNDHIVGLVDLFTELRSQQVNQQPLFVKVGGLWHNSFKRTIDVEGKIAPRL
jgi:glyoxylase-like metal-dependent hydrolase (beta-lactamase superfamily II)